MSNIYQKLQAIQQELKAPKGQFNQFGGYAYRSAEDILEAAKPLLAKHGCALKLSDEMVEVGGRELIEPITRYGVKILSIGFFVDPGSATVWRGPMASNALKQMVEEGFWDELDFMLIDLPPGTSDIHLTLVQTVALSGAVVVSTPQAVALADAVKGINMFESPGISVPVLGLVENMSWFTPAELPDNKYYIFGREGAKRLAEERGLRLLGQIPIVQSIMEAGDAGTPVALDENTITGGAFRDLAQSLVKAVDETAETAHRVRVTR